MHLRTEHVKYPTDNFYVDDVWIRKYFGYMELHKIKINSTSVFLKTFKLWLLQFEMTHVGGMGFLLDGLV